MATDPVMTSSTWSDPYKELELYLEKAHVSATLNYLIYFDYFHFKWLHFIQLSFILINRI